MALACWVVGVAAKKALSICPCARPLLVPEMTDKGDATDPVREGDVFTGVIVGIVNESTDVYLRIVSEDGKHYSEVHMLPKYAVALGQALLVAATRYN